MRSVVASFRAGSRTIELRRNATDCAYHVYAIASGHTVPSLIGHVTTVADGIYRVSFAVDDRHDSSVAAPHVLVAAPDPRTAAQRVMAAPPHCAAAGAPARYPPATRA